MKTLLSIGTPALVMVALSFWLWGTLRQEHEVLLTRRADVAVAAHEANPLAAVPSSTTSDRMTAILAEIQVEEAALAGLQRQTNDLAARMPSTGEDEVIVSFGRIEDMGRETGAALHGLLRQNQQGQQDDPEQMQNAILQWMRMKGRVPEIRDFEKNPAEIARFQSRALQEALGLPAATEAAVQPVIRDTFAKMAAQGLTAGQKPETETEGWTEQRSQALQQLMLKLRPHVPDSDSPAAPQALTIVLNLGAGLETTQHIHGPQQATLTIGVKWPKVPW
ncbi:MAG: hypothetical protein U0984_00530 [Prosthecobacter sp.]|nr:hypothetical protein [Prosthecobacter sp.]